jgi:hypothetical protein
MWRGATMRPPTRSALAVPTLAACTIVWRRRMTRALPTRGATVAGHAQSSTSSSMPSGGAAAFARLPVALPPRAAGDLDLGRAAADRVEGRAIAAGVRRLATTSSDVVSTSRAVWSEDALQ